MATFFCCTDNWVEPAGATFGPVATLSTSAAPVSGARIILLSPTQIRAELKQNQIGRKREIASFPRRWNLSTGNVLSSPQTEGTVENAG